MIAIKSNEIIGDMVEGIRSMGGKKVLLSGGAGFLGSWMAEALLYLGAEVTVVDDLSTGRIENLQAINGKDGFMFIKGDAGSVDASGYDILIHAASIPSPDDYMRRPVRTALSNFSGLLNFLRAESTRLLYFSSSEVYGDPKIVPTPENYWGNVNPVGVRSCYDESKRFGEAICMAYKREIGRNIAIARIHNTYGPRMDPQGIYARAIPRFIRQALSGRAITIYGDGLQTRSFTYVSDMIRGLLLLLQSNETGPINLGSETETSIKELAEKIIGLTSSSSGISYLPPEPDDPKRRRPDIGLARKSLGWQPRVSLEEGLKLTIEWFIKSG
ncbi:MAG: GDP-mannose 4,6-dehydratase, partial [Candidatus Parvarchaeota archaeon]